MRNVAIRGCDSSRHRPWVAPSRRFRNRRIELLEVKGGRGLNAFGGTTLISQVLLAQAIDSVLFILILFAVQLRADGEAGRYE